MRSLSTLYKIAYGRAMNANDGDYNGLCHLISSLLWDKLITWDEKEKLMKSLHKNKPGEWKHPDLAICHEYDECELFWWPRGQMEHRRIFLSKMINRSKPWYVKLFLLWRNKL